MYITNNVSTDANENFDWTIFFKNRSVHPDLNKEERSNFYLSEQNIRKHLMENHFEFTLVMTKLLRGLLKNIEIKRNISIIELGAATGYLSRWLLDEYDGIATLVDNNSQSLQAYKKLNCDNLYNINYLQEDIFKLDLAGRYDIVCSFGLLEHFQCKDKILNLHANLLKDNSSYSIILVPMDTPLNRVYWEVFQEYNQGYRELVTESEFRDLFNSGPLELINVSNTFGYCYDILAGIAKKRSDQ